MFVKDYTVTEGPEKQGKQYRCTVEMTILFDALQKDLNRNKVQTNLGMAVGTPNSQVSLPLMVVTPFLIPGKMKIYVLSWITIRC